MTHSWFSCINFVDITLIIYLCKSSKQTASYLKVTFTEFFELQICIQAPRFSWLNRFLVQMQINFIKLKVHSISAVGEMCVAGVSTLVVLGCQIVYSDIIHCSSIISNECVFFLDSDSFSCSNNLISFSILIYLHTKNILFEDWVFCHIIALKSA